MNATDRPVTNAGRQDAHVDDTEEGIDIGVSSDNPAHHAPNSPDGAAPNPLISEQPTYLVNQSGRLLYLGHSSTWAFSRQVLQMTREHFQTPSPFLNGEAEAYELDRHDPSTVDLSGLPSFEMSMLLLSTVKYRLHPFFHLFDEHEFIGNLHRLYKNPSEYAQAERLNYIHFLVIMALGKSFTSDPSAGLNLFNRALTLLPDVTQLCADAIRPIEVLCSVAMYLECIDHRCAAFAMARYLLTVSHAVQLSNSFPDRPSRAYSPDSRSSYSSPSQRYGRAHGTPVQKTMVDALFH